jgi:Leucine-rich repeat (LRR) protein
VQLVLTELVFTIGFYPTPDLLDCLGALASCTQLRVLRLEGNFYELPPLPSQLEDLVFISHAAKRISVISALTMLKVLDLESCERLTDLTPIQPCRKLESLKMSGRSALASVWPDLGALTALRELRITDSARLGDWSFLAALPDLAHLTFTGFPSHVDVEVLAGLTQLQDLALVEALEQEEDEEEGEGEGEEVWQGRLTSTLTRLVGLSQLSVVKVRLGTLEWCSALPRLTSLCAGSNLFTSLESLPSCPQLLKLYLGCDSASNHLVSLTGLEGLPQLTKLDLGGCARVSSLEPLLACSQLTRLCLSSCTSVSSLQALQGCKKLAKLDLSWCSKVSSLEPLRCCRQLTRLTLNACSQVSSLEPLLSAPCLTLLSGAVHLTGDPGAPPELRQAS